MDIDILSLNVGYEPCQRGCGTPVKLLSWEVIGAPEPITMWYECSYNETVEGTEIEFRQHFCEYEPCERCGTPIRLRDPQPEPEPRHGLPLGAAIWDERPIELDHAIVQHWHSPERCAQLRSERATAR